jgi:hypothetical protein
LAAEVTYEELAERTKKHGFKENKDYHYQQASRNTAPARFHRGRRCDRM